MVRAGLNDPKAACDSLVSLPRQRLREPVPPVLRLSGPTENVGTKQREEITVEVFGGSETPIDVELGGCSDVVRRMFVSKGRGYFCR